MADTRGILIYKKWMLVDNLLYEVIEKKGTSHTAGKGNREFRLALEFHVTKDDIKVQYYTDKIPIGVVRRAKNVVVKRAVDEQVKDLLKEVENYDNAE